MFQYRLLLEFLDKRRVYVHVDLFAVSGEIDVILTEYVRLDWYRVQDEVEVAVLWQVH